MSFPLAAVKINRWCCAIWPSLARTLIRKMKRNAKTNEVKSKGASLILRVIVWDIYVCSLSAIVAIEQRPRQTTTAVTMIASTRSRRQCTRRAYSRPIASRMQRTCCRNWRGSYKRKYYIDIYVMRPLIRPNVQWSTRTIKTHNHCSTTTPIRTTGEKCGIEQFNVEPVQTGSNIERIEPRAETKSEEEWGKWLRAEKCLLTWRGHSTHDSL